MSVRDVKYRISLEEKFSKNMQKAEKSATSFEKKIMNVGKTIVGVFAGRALVNGIGKLTNLWDIQASAIAQVEQGLISTGGAAGRTLQQLQKQATDLQDKTLFGDDVIMRDATAQLITFTNIAGKEFDRTQQAALDLSTRVGQDLKSSAIQLGKALNDPIANLGALGRTGIQFSKEQKEVIKALAGTGRLAEAQRLILDELEKQYGGSAAAARKAGKGGFKALANTLGDLGEIIGKRLLRNTDKLTDGLMRAAKGAARLLDVPLSRELAETRAQLNAELNVLKSSNLTVDQRRGLLEKINAQYKEYLPNLLTEKSSIEDIEAAQKSANRELLKKIEIQAKQEVIQDSINKVATLEKKSIETQISLEKAREELAGNAKDNYEGRAQAAEKAFDLEKKFSRQTKRLTKAQTELQDVMSRLGSVSLEEQTAGGGGVPVIPSSELKAGIQTIKSAAPKTFNITVQKFVENFTVQSETITESGAQVKDFFTEGWIRMLADAQAIAG